MLHKVMNHSSFFCDSFVQVGGGFNPRYHYKEQGICLLRLGGCHHLHNNQTSLFLQATKTVVAKAVNQAHSPLDSSLSLPLHVQPLPQLVLSSPICAGWNNPNNTVGGKTLSHSQFQVLQKCFALKEKDPLNVNNTRVENGSITIEELNTEERGRMEEEESETEHILNSKSSYIDTFEELNEFQIFQGMNMPLAAYKRCLRYASETTSTNVTGVINILSKLGLSKTDIGLVLKKKPALLKIKPIQLTKIFHLLSELGYPETSLHGICIKFPGLLEFDGDELNEVFEYLLSVGMTKEELVSVLHKRPQVLRYPVQKIRFSVNCLLQVGIPKEQLYRILISAVKLFCPVIQHNLQARLEFLLKIGLKPEIIGKAIIRRPNLLGFNSSTSYNYLSKFLEDDDIVKLVSRYPDALLLKPVRLAEIFEYLVRRGVRLND